MVGRKKKVLYIAHGHPDFSPGGGEWAAYYMYQSMKDSEEYEPYFLARSGEKRLQHQGCWLARDEKDDHASLLFSTGNHYDYFFESAISFSGHSSVFHLDLRDYLLYLKPDIVHFHHYVHLGVDLLLFVKGVLPEAKILLTLHEYGAICANKGAMIKTETGVLCFGASIAKCAQCFPDRQPRDFFLREQFFKTNFSVVDLFLSPSHFLKQRYVEWGLEADRIIVMDNGRPLWPKGERAVRHPEQPFVAAFFGQIVFHKGVDVFLEAAAEYRRLRRQAHRAGEKFPEIRFAVHGVKGNLPAKLRKRIEELMDSCQDVVQVHGAYDSRHMPDLLRPVDCIVIPSKWWENSPLTVQEAFMAGVPIVCSKLGGLAEKVTDRVNGLHFLMGDPFDLLDRILELARSPELYGRLVRGIPEVMSDREMALRVHAIYRELMATQDHS